MNNNSTDVSCHVSRGSQYFSGLFQRQKSVLPVEVKTRLLPDSEHLYNSIVKYFYSFSLFFVQVCFYMC